MTLVSRIANGTTSQRADTSSISFDEWLGYFQYGGQIYQFGLNQTLVGNRQRISPNYLGLAQSAFKQDGIIFALIAARLMLFSQARFQFRRRTNGRPGAYFGTTALAPLETPWPGGTTADLLAIAELDVSIAGNFFAALRRDGSIKRMRPDWVTIVLGSDADPGVDGYDLDAEVIGYLYHPGGPTHGKEPTPILPQDMCHYMPIPDPISPWRGMSWLQPVVTEILADKAAQVHKLKYFEQGATPSLFVKLPEPDPEKFKKWVDFFRENYEGTRNAHKSMLMGSGADATVVGSDLKSIDFRAVQAYGEVRLASAAQVPPQVIGLAESLAGSALNDKTYDSALRRFSNLTIRPLWLNFCGSMARVIAVPAGAELYYDDRDIPALQADVLDAATALKVDAGSVNTLIMAGYTPESVIAAVSARDLTLLEHSGLPSVQLQPTQIKGGSPDPEVVVGDGDPEDDEDGSSKNGKPANARALVAATVAHREEEA